MQVVCAASTAACPREESHSSSITALGGWRMLIERGNELPGSEATKPGTVNPELGCRGQRPGLWLPGGGEAGGAAPAARGALSGDLWLVQQQPLRLTRPHPHPLTLGESQE